VDGSGGGPERSVEEDMGSEEEALLALGPPRRCSERSDRRPPYAPPRQPRDEKAPAGAITAEMRSMAVTFTSRILVGLELDIEDIEIRSNNDDMLWLVTVDNVD